MVRLLTCLVLVCSLVVFARPSRRAEATQVLDGFFAGSVGANQALNRIQFLGEERFAVSELLVGLRRTGDARQRVTILELLSQLNVRDPELERAYLSLLNSPELGEVMASARGLGRLKSANAVKPLTGVLQHPLLGARREAARALGDIGRPAAGAALMKAASTETDLEARLAMLRAVGRCGDKKQQPGLEKLLKDASEGTRLAAGQSLCLLGAPACLSFARRLLESSDRDERFSGVMLFDGAPARFAAPVLTPLLSALDARLRARAARILFEGGDSSQLSWLIIESARASGELRLPYEEELERLRVTDEQRQAVLRKAGLQ